MNTQGLECPTTYRSENMSLDKQDEVLVRLAKVNQDLDVMRVHASVALAILSHSETLEYDNDDWMKIYSAIDSLKRADENIQKALLTLANKWGYDLADVSAYLEAYDVYKSVTEN